MILNDKNMSSVSGSKRKILSIHLDPLLNWKKVIASSRIKIKAAFSDLQITKMFIAIFKAIGFYTLFLKIYQSLLVASFYSKFWISFQ